MKTQIQKLSLLALLGAAISITPRASAQITTWTGAGADQNWSTAGNWSTSGGSTPPGTVDTVVFNDAAAPASAGAAGTVDSILDTSRSISGLQYINTSAAGHFHTTQIADGQTLTLNGALNVGVAGQTTVSGMTGNGNFTVNNITGNINIGGGGISTATVTFTLGNGTNTLNALTLSIGESASNNGRQCNLNLGAGPTIINADTLNLGTGKGSGTIQWTDPTFTNGLTIRNHTGTGRASLLLGNGTSGSGSSNGKILALGHPVDILAGNIVLGRLGNDTGNQQGTLSFDSGTVDATSLLMELLPAAGAGAGTANSSVLTVGGNPTNTATLIVNSPGGPGGGSFIVSGSSNAAAGRVSSATFNLLTNGVVQTYCSIVKAMAANNTATFNLSGTLNMEAATNTIGTRLAPIDNVTLDFATLIFAEDGSSLNLSASTLTLNDTNVVNIVSLPPIIHLPTVIPIMTYTTLGSALNLGVGTLPGDYQGNISDDGAGTISLVITSGTVVVAHQDKWVGNVNNNWDTTTLNWLSSGVAASYSEADFVTFDDTATTGNVTLLGNQHTPGSVTVANSTLSYVLSGIGKISGSPTLTKSGSGSLTLSESGGDNFSGGIAVHGGTLILDNANSAISGGMTNDVGTVVQIGNNDASGVLPLGNLDIEGTLAYGRSNNVTVATVIAGGGGLVQKGSGTLTLSGASTYSGNTIVSNGALAFSSVGTVASPLISVKNATLNLTTAVSQAAFGTVALTNGTLQVGANTTLFNFTTLAVSNSSIVINADVFGAGTLSATTLNSGGTSNNITIPTIQNLTLTPAFPTIIPLITYSSFGGSFNFAATLPVGISGYISNDVSTLTVRLVITNAPQTIVWNGGSATGNNWSDAANWTGVAINPLDALTFDGILRTNNVNDSAAGTKYSGITFNSGAGPFTLSGNSINLAGTIVNNNSIDETVNLGLALTGNATLDGGFAGGTLVMRGAITNAATNDITLTNLNSGTISDLWQSTNGGLLEMQVGSGGIWTILDGTGSGTLVPVGRARIHINPSATGEFDYGTSNSAPNIDLGFTTNGQISIDGLTSGTFAMNNGTLKANSFVSGGSGTQHGLLNMNGGTLIIGNGGFTAGGGNGAGSFTTTITNGSIYITNGGGFVLTQRSPSTINQSGGLLQLGTIILATGTTIGGNGIYNLNGGTFSATNISVGRDGNNAWGLVNYNGGTLKVGGNSTVFFSQVNLAPLTNIVQSGGAVIDTAGFNTTFNVPFLTDPNLGGVQDGGLIKQGAGILTLSTPNTYNGSNTVNAGTLFVSGSVLGDVKVNATGTLAGTGSVGGNVVANGTIAPGTTNNNGVLTVVSNVTLSASGTAAMKLKKGSLTNDVLSVTDAAGTITYGGTLSLTNISGSLAANDTFKLFNAANYAGSFASIVPATPGAGLTWNTNNLIVNGTLSIVGGSTPTTNANILSVKLSGTNLLIHGTNNNGGQNFHYAVLTSTNITTPLSNWTSVVTNPFNTDGTFDYSTPVDPTQPRLFIDVKAVP